jgi:hypothetical protein
VSDKEKSNLILPNQGEEKKLILPKGTKTSQVKKIEFEGNHLTAEEWMKRMQEAYPEMYVLCCKFLGEHKNPQGLKAFFKRMEDLYKSERLKRFLTLEDFQEKACKFFNHTDPKYTPMQIGELFDREMALWQDEWLAKYMKKAPKKADEKNSDKA